MNRSEIFRNAHKSVKFSIRTNIPFQEGLSYSERLSYYLKAEYKKAKPAKVYTIKIAYSQKKEREIIKKNGGIWNASAKTWTLETNNLPSELDQYIVTDSKAKQATKPAKAEWWVNGRKVRNNKNWSEMYKADPFLNFE